MIEIRLLSNRRFIYANRNQSIVITAENQATEIVVEFPEEYEGYSKRVDFINSHGRPWTEGLYIPEYKEYPSDYNRCLLTFKLPNEVTAPGEMKMQFLAYKPDNSMTAVPFEIVPIYIDDGIVAFKKNGKNNPDLLMLSYNQSTEALFNSQQAKAKAKQSEEMSRAAADTAEVGKAIAEGAAALADEAKQISEETVNKAVEAARTADEAKSIAESVINAADEASGKAENALQIAKQAKVESGGALDIAAIAEDKAAHSLASAIESKDKSATAIALADEAKDSAQTANEKADRAEGLSEQAKTIAQTAENKATNAVVTADGAMLKIDAAKAQADYAKSKSEYALECADEAVEIANDASGIATQAKNKAAQAEQSAISAQNLVATAISDSENAVAVATAIDYKAQLALDRSQQAKEESTVAKEKSEAALEVAETAQNLIYTANNTAQTANEVASRAEVKAEQASAAASRAEEAVEEISNTAMAADDKASAALLLANEVKAESEQVKHDAEQSRTSAEQAEEAAQQAKESAEAGVASIEVLTETVAVLREDTETCLINKVDKVAGKGLSSEDYTFSEKSKLADIENNANNYTHPSSHPPSIIAQDEENRFVSDTEKSEWNAKAEKTPATQSSAGLISAEDKTKLDGIAAGAQVNAVTSVAGKTGAVSLVKTDVGLGNVDNTSDANKPISTSTQTALNNKVDKVSGKQLSTEDYSSTEKTKLAGIAEGAQVNTVTGIKGSSESSYRTGSVNITAANVGAEPAFAKNGAFNKNFGTASGTVCEGNDSRLSNARPASDVYSWAKAASKPSYTASEVGAIPTSSISQAKGTSTTQVMSQKIVTDELNLITDALANGGLLGARFTVGEHTNVEGVKITCCSGYDFYCYNTPSHSSPVSNYVEVVVTKDKVAKTYYFAQGNIAVTWKGGKYKDNTGNHSSAATSGTLTVTWSQPTPPNYQGFNKILRADLVPQA